MALEVTATRTLDADGMLALRPDYRRAGIVNLMSSVQRGMGGAATSYPELNELPAATFAAARNVVLFIVDGLGYHYLRERPGEGTLRRHLRGRLSSVFPSTTASAITTFLTGTAPQQHGLTGWFTYFRELGGVVAPLPFKPRFGGDSLRLAGVEARRLFDRASLFEQIEARAHIVLPERIAHSDYTCAHAGPAERHAYASLEECFRCVRDILRSGRERSYIYAYWPDLDSTAHDHGIGSTAVADLFAMLEAAFARFFGGIAGSDTLVIVTADHGFIDSTPEQLVSLEDHPELADTLALPLCGEPRAAFCYVRPDRCQEFESYVRTQLADRVVLMRSAKLIEQGLFGVGTPHPRLAERIGDYALLMRENYAIKDWLLGERRFVHIGVHGGLSEQELYVPLVVHQT